MTAKRVPGQKRPPPTKASSPTPILTDQAVLVVLEVAKAPEPASGTMADVDHRRQLIAAEAYYMAERRGFAPGYELADWVAAETLVDAKLVEMQVA